MKTEFFTTRLEKAQKKKAKIIGKGNPSEGVRIAIDAYKLPVKSITPEDIKVNINK